MNNIRHITGGLAQAGQWLARKFVQIWKFIARPNGSESPACAKPLGRYATPNSSGGRDEKLLSTILKKSLKNCIFAKISN